MPHERDVLKPRAHMAHIRLIGSELLGLERDHSGVISAWFEHDQILAGTECIGVGSHRFDGHTGLTDFLANLVAGADLPGIDGLVAGQSDLDAIGRVNTAEVLPSALRLVMSVQASSKPRPSRVGLLRRSKMPETGSSPVGSRCSSTVT